MSCYLFGYSSCGQANGAAINSDADLAQVSLGWEHTAVVTVQRELYVWGSNEFGQRGDGASDGDAGTGRTAEAVGAIKPMTKQQVVAVSCGAHHTAALTSDGDVFSWGRYQRTSMPRQVDLPAPVLQVACGGRHTLALLETSRMFAWGYNDYGQLGSGRTSQCLQCEPSEIASLEEREFDTESERCEVQPHPRAYIDDHSASEGESGSDWSSAGEKKCMSGGGERLSLQCRLRRRPVFVAAGGEHSLCLDRKGRVYSWGNGASGQLGHADLQSKAAKGRAAGVICAFPRRVTAMDLLPCSTVIAGHAYSIALSERGAVYVWGSNGDGQLGLGVPPCAGLSSAREAVEASIAVWSPELLVEQGVSRVSCGTSHTLFLKEDGEVLGCGYNLYCQACGPHQHGTSAPSRTLWSFRPFSHTSLPPKSVVCEVACGGGHSALLVNVGSEAAHTRAPRPPVVLENVAGTVDETAKMEATRNASAACVQQRTAREGAKRRLKAMAVDGLVVGACVGVVVRRADHKDREADPTSLYTFLARPARAATVGVVCELLLDNGLGKDLEVELGCVELWGEWEALRQGLAEATGEVEILAAAESLVQAGNVAMTRREAAPVAAAYYSAALKGVRGLGAAVPGGDGSGILAAGATCVVRQAVRRARGLPEWRPAMVSCQYGGTPGEAVTYDVLYEDDRKPDEEVDVEAKRVTDVATTKAGGMSGGAMVAVAAAKSRVRAGCNLSRVLLALGEAQGALHAASAACGADPDSAKAVYLRARAREELGELEAAATDARKVVRLVPNSVDARELLARCKLALAERRSADRSLLTMALGIVRGASVGVINSERTSAVIQSVRGLLGALQTLG